MKDSLRKNAHSSRFINKIIAKETLPHEEDNEEDTSLLYYSSLNVLILFIVV